MYASQQHRASSILESLNRMGGSISAPQDKPTAEPTQLLLFSEDSLQLEPVPVTVPNERRCIKPQPDVGPPQLSSFIRKWKIPKKRTMAEVCPVRRRRPGKSESSSPANGLRGQARYTNSMSASTHNMRLRPSKPTPPISRVTAMASKQFRRGTKVSRRIKSPRKRKAVSLGPMGLIIRKRYLELILQGGKTKEIRSRPCYGKVGKEIYLLESGKTKMINGVNHRHVRGRCKVLGMEKMTLHALQMDRECGLDAEGIQFCKDRYIRRNGHAWAWVLGELKQESFWTPVVMGCVIWSPVNVPETRKRTKYA